MITRTMALPLALALVWQPASATAQSTVARKIFTTGITIKNGQSTPQAITAIERAVGTRMRIDANGGAAALPKPLPVGTSKSVGDFLNRWLKDSVFAWTIHNGSLVITTRERVWSALPRRTFAVQEILREVQGLKPEKLENAVRARVTPLSWRDSGGRAQLHVVNNRLLVTHTWSGQHRVEMLLNQWRNRLKRKEVPVVLIHPPRGHLARVLEARLDFNVSGDLPSVARQLSRRFRIPFNLKGSDTSNLKVQLRLKKVRVRDALHLLLQNIDWSFQVNPKSITLLSKGDNGFNEIRRSYDVSWLPRGDRLELATFESWREMQLGDSGDDITHFRLTASDHVHYLFGQLLMRLRQLHRERQMRPQKSRLAPYRIGTDPVAYRQLRNVWDRPLANKTKLTKVRLDKITGELSRRIGIPVLANQHALDEIGVGNDAALSFNPAFGRLRDCIQQMNLKYFLTFENQNGVLALTTKEQTEAETNLQIYPVHDIVTVNGQLKPAQAELLANHLINEIQSHTGYPAPGWAEDGGAGIVAYIRSAGVLVIATTSAVHQQVEAFLRTLRRAKANLARPVGKRKIELRTLVSNASFNRRVSISFKNIPLQQLATKLSKQTGVPIELDFHGLKDQGYSGKERVSVTGNQQPLMNQLSRAIAPLKLAVERRGQALLITTPDVAETNLTCAFYSVADLIGAKTSKGVVGSLITGDYDPILEAIQQHTGLPEPGWINEGGAGQIGQFRVARSLVVSSTEAVHQECRTLIQALSRFQKNGKNRKPQFVGSAESGKLLDKMQVKLAQSLVKIRRQTNIRQLVIDLSKAFKLGSPVFKLDHVDKATMQTKLQWRPKEPTLGLALRSKLEQVGLDWSVRHGRLVIHETNDPLPYTVLYPIEADSAVDALLDKSVDVVVSAFAHRRCLIVTAPFIDHEKVRATLAKP